MTAQTFQFGFLILALTNEQGFITPFGALTVTAVFCLSHSPAVGIYGFIALTTHCGQRGDGGQAFLRLFDGGYLSVESGNFGFSDLEISVRLLGVENGRNKPRPIIATADKTGIGSKKSQTSVRTSNHENPEHLSAADLTAPCSCFGVVRTSPFATAGSLDITAHFGGSGLAERMGNVTERIGEPRGRHDRRLHRMEP